MSVSVKSSDIATIVYCVYYDHTELFRIENSFTYYMNSSGIVTSLIVNFNGIANSLKEAQQVFEKTIAPLIYALGGDYPHRRGAAVSSADKRG